jgi:hypothetical protein
MQFPQRPVALRLRGESQDRHSDQAEDDDERENGEDPFFA